MLVEVAWHPSLLPLDPANVRNILQKNTFILELIIIQTLLYYTGQSWTCYYIKVELVSLHLQPWQCQDQLHLCWCRDGGLACADTSRPVSTLPGTCRGPNPPTSIPTACVSQQNDWVWKYTYSVRVCESLFTVQSCINSANIMLHKLIICVFRALYWLCN